MTAKTTTDEKLDQIQEILADLVKLAGKTADDAATLKTDVATLKTDVATLKTDVATLKKDMSDVQDEQERQGRKLDQISGSFTPGFTSGAFAA